MPRIRPRFTVEAPAEEVWAFLTDMKKIGSCMPGCTVKQLDTRTFAWEMRAKVGPIGRTFRLKTRVVSQDDASHIAEFVGSGDGLEVRGFCRLADAPSNGTLVNFELHINGRGSVGHVVNKLIDMKLGEYESTFVSRVKGQLEATAA